MDASVKQSIAAAVGALALGGGGGYFGSGAIEGGERQALQERIEALELRQTEQTSSYQTQAAEAAEIFRDRMDAAGALCTEHMKRSEDRCDDHLDELRKLIP